jgi:hypothetical protein
LRELFERVAQPVTRRGTKGAWYQGWRVMAIDGVVLDMPDTGENREVFGKRGDTAFPQLRLVGLGECGTHAIVAAAFDAWRIGERKLFERILDQLRPGMLVLADSGYYSYQLWSQTIQTGAELVWRVGDTLDLPVEQWLEDGSYRSSLLPKQIKGNLKRGKTHSQTERLRRPVRVIEYMVTNRGESTETIRLVTSITDHELAPAVELAALYQQRWEFELTLDEIETHQMSHTRLLRSKTPELVRQEVWALLLTHYAVREFMHEAADPPGPHDSLLLDVDQLSFTRSLNAVRRQVTNQAGFSPSPPDHRDPRHH